VPRSRFFLLLSILVMTGCDACDEEDSSLPPPAAFPAFATTRIVHCCDPSKPPPADGYYLGTFTVTNSNAYPLFGALDVHGSSLVVYQGDTRLDRAVELAPGANVFNLYSPTCPLEDLTLDLSVLLPNGPLPVTFNTTVTVVRECPDPPPPPPPEATIIEGCSTTAKDERLAVAPEGDQRFGDTDLKFVTAGVDGGRCCKAAGTLLKEVAFEILNGSTILPEVPAGSPAPAPEAICFHGSNKILITPWDSVASAFGFTAVGGLGRNWTDVVPSGDPKATDHFLAVDFTGRRVSPIVPVPGPAWGLLNTNVVPAVLLDAAWGGPVTAVREERTGDICLALEPSLTDPGNFVVAAMGGDDVADSATLVGTTGPQPRVLRGLDGVYGVTCFGGSVFSLFRKTATGYAKIVDETVGSGPLGNAVKRLANGDVAFLVACSGSDQVFVIIVDPLTGTVVSKAEIAVPAELDGATDAAWGNGGEVFILGRDSHNIARIDAGIE
jgi:hypothetical protein